MKAILTFHSIDNTGSILSYPVELFRQLLEELISKNIPILSLSQLLEGHISSGVAITFDDGMQSVYENALPVLTEMGIPAHVFVSTSAIDKEETWGVVSGKVPGYKMMSWEQLEKLHACGVMIESHTHTHPDMRELTADQISFECSRADYLIENRLGRKPSYFAYPYGYHNELTRKYVGMQYKAAVTTELKKLTGKEEMAALPRLDSYYFKTPLSIKLLDKYVMNAYFSFRCILRNIKGSQCKANA